MTPTERALSAIVDASMFERLMTELLRDADPQLRALTHTGINDQGQPIPAPLDGFAMVENSHPPKFIAVAHTVTKEKELPRKWLAAPGGSKPVGDVLKAIKSAQGIRARFPNALVTLVLTTTRRVDKELQLDVKAQLDAHGVELELWELSRVAAQLENSPHGQWLRKKYLDIPPELVSVELMRSVGRETLAQHAVHCLAHSKPSDWIERQQPLAALEEADRRAPSVIAVVARSGFGKSVLVHQYGRRLIEQGELCVWVDPARIEQAPTPEQLLTEVVASCFDTYDCSNIGSLGRIRVIVDDVNRVESPGQLMRRLVAWSGLVKSGRTEVTFLVPLWHDTLNLVSRSDEALDGVIRVEPGALSVAEAQRVIQSRLAIPDEEARVLAMELGHDPVLVGLVSSRAQRADEVVEGFVRDTIAELAQLDSTIVMEDARIALVGLARECVRHINLRPTWEEITSWLDGPSVGVLRKLQRSGRLFSFDAAVAGAQMNFRHDRIQDALLLEPLAAFVDENRFDEPPLNDPYFAPTIGRLLARHPPTDGVIAKLATTNPIALFHAVRFGLGSRLERWLRPWLERALVDRTDSAVAFAAESVLAETEHPKVLDLTRGLALGWRGLLARLRNGCADSGALYLGRRQWLVAGDAAWDAAFRRGQELHSDRLMAGLDRCLRRTDIDARVRFGALALAGKLGDAKLADAVAACWAATRASGQSLGEIAFVAVFAACRCAVDGPPALLDEILTEYERHDAVDRHHLDVNQLRLAFGAYPVHATVLRSIVDRAQQTSSTILWTTLSAVDDPYVLSSIARYSEVGTNRHLLPPWRKATGDLSPTSADALCSVWRDEGAPKEVRRRAFKMWSGSADLSSLRSMPRDAAFDDLVVSLRLEHGDSTVIDELADELRDGSWRLEHAAPAWSSTLEGIVDQVLSNVPTTMPSEPPPDCTDALWYVSQLLFGVPSRDAARLLETHWPRISRIDHFVHVALFHCETATVRLAAASLHSDPNPRSTLAHITSSFAFGFMDSRRRDRLAKPHLRVLEPYLDLLGQWDLYALAQFCEARGYDDWFDTHLVHRVDDDVRKRHRPNVEDILEKLNEIEGAVRPHSASYWGHRWLELRVGRATILRAVGSFLGKTPSESQLIVASGVLEAVGTRADLKLIERHLESATPKAASAIENARFWVRSRGGNVRERRSSPG